MTSNISFDNTRSPYGDAEGRLDEKCLESVQRFQDLLNKQLEFALKSSIATCDVNEINSIKSLSDKV